MLHGEFLIRIVLCKVRVWSEYNVLAQIIRKNACQQMSEFDKGRIIVQRECGLSSRDIARHTVQHPFTVMRIWNKWVAEDHTE